MHTFLGILRYEYRMMIYLRTLWVAYAIFYPLAGLTLSSPPIKPQANTPYEIWAAVGFVAYMLNLFMPVICGNLAADRMHRDVQLGLRELQYSTPLNNWAYILGKYVGVL